MATKNLTGGETQTKTYKELVVSSTLVGGLQYSISLTKWKRNTNFANVVVLNYNSVVFL